jgi:hypothetical protein
MIACSFIWNLSPEGALYEICRRQISFQDPVRGKHDPVCLVFGEQERGVVLRRGCRVVILILLILAEKG